jgi:hypothetical protein
MSIATEISKLSKTINRKKREKEEDYGNSRRNSKIKTYTEVQDGGERSA